MYRRIIVVTGMPRSGTAWISMIIDSCPSVRYRQSPLFTYEFKNRCNESSLKEEWDELFRAVYSSTNEFMDQTQRRAAGEFPVFKDKKDAPEILLVKFDRYQNLIEPLLRLFPDLRVVSVIRHPCGAIHSWLTAPREFPPDADPLAYWRSGSIKKSGYGDHYGFDDWKALARAHLKLEKELPDRFRIQRYEKMVQDPVEEAKAMFAFLGLDYSAQTVHFIGESHSRHEKGEYAVYKDPAVKDRWRRELQPEIRDAILDELAGTDLAFLLED